MNKYTFEQLMNKAQFTPTTKADTKKAEYAYNLYVKGFENGDSGAYGKAVEILSRRPNSHKTTVAKQGKKDATARIDGKLIAVEVKTNGGRVDGIKAKYVVYSLDVHNSTADKTITARIIPTDVFIKALYDFNAIKEVRHNSIVDGLAIQPSKRKLWAWLETMPEYDRTKDYTSDEIA